MAKRMKGLFPTDWREVWGEETPPESASIYTRPDIVDLILDLAGYTEDQPLAEQQLIEPSCGGGAFLCAIVARLISSEQKRTDGDIDWTSPGLRSAICAADISANAVTNSQKLVQGALIQAGCPKALAATIMYRWVFQTDFLLHDWGTTRFDYVIGNPPYVRLEEIPSAVLTEYRDAYSTASDRADLYIPFFECSLDLLNPKGKLAFICANRFVKNQYGSSLRKMIARSFHVSYYLNLEQTQPFMSDVSAYPAIIVLDREQGTPTYSTSVDDLSQETLVKLRTLATDSSQHRFETWYADGGPWISTCSHRQRKLSELEELYPTLEESAPGTRVGIGIATGADAVYVLPKRNSEIEDVQQIPLILAGDIRSGKKAWSGHYLVNPFSPKDDGRLADFLVFPGLAKYLESHESRLKARHCAKNRPDDWYRPIDRFWPSLVSTPKLLIPDIQQGGIVSYDSGQYYPHHNVYWITSDTWDLKELQAILRHDFVTQQVRAHSVAMRGGSLRYQAQVLRRLRIPRPEQAAEVLEQPNEMTA